MKHKYLIEFDNNVLTFSFPTAFTPSYVSDCQTLRCALKIKLLVRKLLVRFKKNEKTSNHPRAPARREVKAKFNVICFDDKREQKSIGQRERTAFKKVNRIFFVPVNEENFSTKA